MFGLIAFVNVNNDSSSTNGAKMICIAAFVLPIVVAVFAAGSAFAISRDMVLVPVTNAVGVGVVFLTMMFSSAMLSEVSQMDGTYTLASLAALFTGLGSGMAIIFLIESLKGPSLISP